MGGKVFIDTNIWVYAAAGEGEKHQRCSEFLTTVPDELIISHQVLHEFYSVMLKKNVPEKLIREKTIYLKKSTRQVETDFSLIQKAWDIRDNTGFSYWDSLIVAAAIKSGCARLITEDLQHGQIISGRLEIHNPIL